ncbi:hypothetical protein [Kitasatospora sp. NPDC056184]
MYAVVFDLAFAALPCAPAGWWGAARLLTAGGPAAPAPLRL